MASGKSGVHVLQLKPAEVPEFLIEGEKFYKFEDVEKSCLGSYVTVQLDPKGQIIYWTGESSKGSDTYQDLLYVVDTRVGKYAKQPQDFDKMRDQIPVNPGFSQPTDDCLFTLVVAVNTFAEKIGSDQKITFLTFIAPTPEVAQKWGDSVFKIATNPLTIHGGVRSFINRQYAKIMYGHSSGGKIAVAELINQLSGNREDGKRVEQAIKAAGLEITEDNCILCEKLSEDHFFLIYRVYLKRSELHRLFADLQGGNSTPSGKIDKKEKERNGNQRSDNLSLEDFVKFLNNEQRDPRLNEILYPYYNERSAMRLIETYEPQKEIARKNQLSFDGFLAYLLSEENGVLAEEQYDLRIEDLNQPLPHYFIASSHNTYLPGRQFGGRASVEMYRQVLLTNCRCIELDCWDGNGDEPVITHGFAMTTEILFKDVIEAIAETAMKISEYPLILSFENHCSPKQQAKMAMHCKRILGDLLLTDPIPNFAIEPGVPLPSPQALMRKILIKNKKKHGNDPQSRSASLKFGAKKSQGNAASKAVFHVPNEPDSGVETGTEVTGTLSQPDSNTSDYRETSRTQTPELSHTRSSESSAALDIQEDTGPTELSDEESLDDCEDLEPIDTGLADVVPVPPKSRREVEADQELSSLVNYMEATAFRSFQAAEKKDKSNEICSFTEAQAMAHLSSAPTDFVNYNKRQFSRIYPKGTRVESSNFLPQLFWNAGCQMAALNYQTLDLGMQLNLAVFEMNGRSGYILKPECMRRRDRHFDPFEENTVENVVANTVTIQVISGQFISKNRVDTHVMVEMLGLPIDSLRCRDDRYRSQSVRGNGINPVYNSAEFKFPKIILPQLANLRIAVINERENSKIIGQRILPVVGLRPGYRHISLRNNANQPLGLATLFVRIKVRDYVPAAHIDFAEALVNPTAYISRLKKAEEMMKSLMDEEGEEKTSELNRSAEPDQKKTSISIPSSKPKNEANSLKNLPNQKLPAKDNNLLTPKISLPPAAISSVNSDRSKSDLELHIFTYTGSENLRKDAKYVTLLRKQSKELESAEKRMSKDLSTLESKQKKRLEALKSSFQKSSGKPGFRMSKKSEKNNLSSSDVSRDSSDLKQLQKSNQQEVSELESQFKREKVDFLTRYYHSVQELKRNQILQRKELLTTLCADCLKYTLKTLDVLYNRSNSKLMSETQDWRKLKLSELDKQSLTREESTNQKNKIREETINKSVNHGKFLTQVKGQRMEEIEKNFRDIQDRITVEINEELESLNEETKRRLTDKEFEFDEVTPL